MSKEISPFIPSFNSLEHASETFLVLDSLCSERQSWQENEYITSTARLYVLLGSVQGVYQTNFVDAKDDDRRTLRQQLIGKLNAEGIRVVKSTDTLGLLIRYVFKCDRRRVMSYKYAILAANSHGITSDKLAEWLSDSGGLEEVVRKVSFNQETIDRREAAVEAVNRVQELISKRKVNPVAMITIPNSKVNSRVMLLAESCGNGEFKILFVFDEPSDGVQKALIRKAAKSNVDIEVENEAVQIEANKFIKFANINSTQVAQVAQAA